MTRDQKVQYVLSHVNDANDAYYLIKSLYDSNVKILIEETSDFLDTHSAKKCFKYIHQ